MNPQVRSLAIGFPLESPQEGPPVELPFKADAYRVSKGTQRLKLYLEFWQPHKLNRLSIEVTSDTYLTERQTSRQQWSN